MKIKLLIVAVVLLLLGFGCWGWYWLGLKAKGGGIVKEIHIPPRTGDEEVAEMLAQEGLIRSPYVFRLYAFLTGKDKQIKAGTYLLNSDLSISEILDILVAGRVITYKITIPEGLSLKEIDSYLAKKYKQYGFRKGAFEKAAQRHIQEASRMFPAWGERFKQFGLEGLLLGDTYFLKTEEVTDNLVVKMLSNFQEKGWSLLSQQLPDPLKNSYQALILASLVEKEAQTERDRRLVAGIFLERLKNNDYLQSCASVNYLLSKKKKVLSSEDIKIDSPYNTYRVKGLPPAPIASPSLESIDAVFHPLHSSYYYFLSDRNGRLHFSRTYEEHLRLREKIWGE